MYLYPPEVLLNILRILNKHEQKEFCLVCQDFNKAYKMYIMGAIKIKDIQEVDFLKENNKCVGVYVNHLSLWYDNLDEAGILSLMEVCPHVEVLSLQGSTELERYITLHNILTNKDLNKWKINRRKRK